MSRHKQINFACAACFKVSIIEELKLLLDFVKNLLTWCASTKCGIRAINVYLIMRTALNLFLNRFSKQLILGKHLTVFEVDDCPNRSNIANHTIQLITFILIIKTNLIILDVKLLHILVQHFYFFNKLHLDILLQLLNLSVSFLLVLFPFEEVLEVRNLSRYPYD